MTLAVFLLVAGIVTLVVGADFMVRGASRLAVTLGLSTLFVGLTVVAFATSAPELVVCLRSALEGYPDLAIGNVVGSNIANICVILGISAMITPIRCSPIIVRRDLPILIAATLLFWFFTVGSITRLESVALVVGLIVYVAFSYRQVRASRVMTIDVEDLTAPPAKGGWIRDVIFIVIGVAGLTLGSEWLVAGAVTIAEHFKMSEAVIGLTVVAVGTSLPEVATSLVAALKKDPDLAVGNVVGSNLWNLLCVAGISGTIDGLPVGRDFVTFDIPVMAGLTILLLPIMATGGKISRVEGLFLLALYVGFVAIRLLGLI